MSVRAGAGLLGLALLLGAGSQVRAQAGLANGDFAHNLSAWQSLEGIAPAQARWVSEDVDGLPGSGAVELRNPQPGNGGTQVVLTQCVSLEGVGFPLPAGFSAWVDGEGESGIEASVLYTEFNDAHCQLANGFQPARSVTDGTPGWQSVQFDYQPLAGSTRSVRVSLALRKGVGSGLGGRVLFDQVRLGAARSLPRLRKQLIAAGGGHALAAGLSTDLSVGQAAAGRASAAGQTLVAGFWARPARQQPPAADRVFADGFEALGP